jgi:hypothetical protein
MSLVSLHWNIPRVIVLALTCAAGGVVPLAAQEQEKTVQDKLFGKPDMSLEFVPRSLDGKQLLKEFKSPSAPVKPFLFRERFRGKEFKTEAFRAQAYSTKAFVGQKEYATRDALANWRENAGMKSLVKDADGLKSYNTVAARDAGKSMPGGEKAYATNDAAMRGKSQKELDQQYSEKPPLTIDQVRELLNKND